MRRPLSPKERPILAALGQRLRELRLAAGLTQAQLAEAADMRSDSISRLERGIRRTRRSTLERLVAGSGCEPELVEELAMQAGPALAPESPYADRIARRRARRRRKREVERERARYREERAELERRWAESTARHLEFRATIRLALRSVDMYLRALGMPRGRRTSSRLR